MKRLHRSLFHFLYLISTWELLKYSFFSGVSALTTSLQGAFLLPTSLQPLLCFPQVVFQLDLLQELFCVLANLKFGR